MPDTVARLTIMLVHQLCFQNTVFNDLGIGVLNNAWEGFNSTLFAYGQTGSGKSWSVVGYGINAGKLPFSPKVQVCTNIYPTF